MSTSIVACWKTFRKDERGSIAVVFGLTAVIATFFVGMAIDVGRVVHARSSVAAASDAAALAAARALRLEGKTESQAIEIGTAVFHRNLAHAGGRWTNIDAVDFSVDPNSGEVAVDVTSHVNLIFAGVLGFNQADLPTHAAAMFDKNDIEVSVQLDLTGSMCTPYAAPCTSAPKIQGLKDATKELIDILLPDTVGPRNVRVAFAPFTAGVNVGSYQAAVADGRTTADNCVYERVSETSQATDLAPTANDSYMIRPDLQAQPYNVANPRPCPNAPVVPLSSDKEMLKTTVDAYVADGFTAGHNGTAWAWNLISPDWASIWPADSRPAPYNDANTVKSVILMTDGEYNTKNGKGGNAASISQLAVDTCVAMKARGVRVYTVGFALGGNQTAIDTLAACASGAGDFFQAATVDELSSAFRNIGSNIMRLRLTS
ncbi:MAG: pilus assembly protein TadG-related protein [Hyphomicrobiaceae bacterium]